MDGWRLFICNFPISITQLPDSFTLLLCCMSHWTLTTPNAMQCNELYYIYTHALFYCEEGGCFVLRCIAMWCDAMRCLPLEHDDNRNNIKIFNIMPSLYNKELTWSLNLIPYSYANYANNTFVHYHLPPPSFNGNWNLKLFVWSPELGVVFTFTNLLPTLSTATTFTTTTTTTD